MISNQNIYSSRATAWSTGHETIAETATWLDMVYLENPYWLDLWEYQRIDLQDC